MRSRFPHGRVQHNFLLLGAIAFLQKPPTFFVRRLICVQLFKCEWNITQWVQRVNAVIICVEGGKIQSLIDIHQLHIFAQQKFNAFGAKLY